MKRCPNCGRFRVDYDPCSGIEKCLWNDCCWTNKDNINLSVKRFELNFKKFERTIKEKRGIAV